MEGYWIMGADFPLSAPIIVSVLSQDLVVLQCIALPPLLSPALPWYDVLASPLLSVIIVSFLRPPSHASCTAYGTVSQ